MWDGRIDEVMFHEGKLTAREIYDIYEGISAGDNELPSIPADLTALNVTSSTVSLSWGSSSDNTGVAGYKIFRDGAEVATSSTNSYQDHGLLPENSYSYTVSAYDYAGNESQESEQVTITTNAISTSEEIVFVTEGASFSPVITVRGNPAIEWVWADGTASSLAAPVKDYGTEGTRTNRLRVEPWSAVKRINIGYDGGDGGTNLIEHVPDQRVSSVEGLEVVAPYLVEWCSSYNEIETLDFSDFVSLETIECYYSRTLTNVNLNNTQNLKRACFEDCDLESLDLSQSPNLEDLRGARNRYTSINFGDTREHVWHICVRSNTQITESFPPMTEFPVLRDLYIWNTNQTGHLEVSSPVIQILASNNHYTSADFSEAHFNGSGSIVMDNNDLNTINISGCEGIARIHLKYNNLTSIDISGITTIYSIEMNSNNLTESAVEDILYNLDLSGVRDGNVNLSGETNSAPNENALIYASNLAEKGWTVILEGWTAVPEE